MRWDERRARSLRRVYIALHSSKLLADYHRNEKIAADGRLSGSRDYFDDLEAWCFHHNNLRESAPRIASLINEAEGLVGCVAPESRRPKQVKWLNREWFRFGHADNRDLSGVS